MSNENPGASMAAAVDSEIAKFRELQQEIHKIKNDVQTLVSQQNENEMVKQELDLLNDSTTVYKILGPVLMKNDLEDAKQTVNNRLEFIRQEREQRETALKEKELKAAQIATKVQEMQAAMQQAAVEAAKAVAAEAGRS